MIRTASSAGSSGRRRWRERTLPAPADAEGALDVNAKRSEDGKTLVLQVVNRGDQAISTRIHIAGFVPGKPVAQVTELSGPLDAVNTSDKTDAVVPRQSAWKHELVEGDARRAFPPHSFTVVRFE